MRRMKHSAFPRPRARIMLAELLDPFGEESVAGGFDVHELDAHADGGRDDSHESEACDDLPFAGESHAHACFHRQGLAGTNKTTAKRDIGGHTGGLGSGFHIDQLDVRREGITNRITAIAHPLGGRAFGRAIIHDDYVAHWCYRPDPWTGLLKRDTSLLSVCRKNAKPNVNPAA